MNSENSDEEKSLLEKRSSETSGKQQRTNKKKKIQKVINNWVYITGLPKDVTLEEINSHFSKVGLISINPVDQQQKIKLYQDEEGYSKGDCSICYNAEESVKMAVDYLSGGYIRPTHQVTVTRADFAKVNFSVSLNKEGLDASDQNIQKIKASKEQIKVAKLVMEQALSWNEDDDIGVSKSKALKIVVIEGLFKIEEFNDPMFMEDLEQDIATECEKCGEIEKITIFSKNIRGIVVVKFSTAYAGNECIKLMNNRYFGGNKIKCYYWDGVTDYSITSASFDFEKIEKDEDERLEKFGDWLEQGQEELPPELQLKIEK